jgi:hypothetical protein
MVSDYLRRREDPFSSDLPGSGCLDRSNKYGNTGKGGRLESKKENSIVYIVDINIYIFTIKLESAIRALYVVRIF